MANEFDSIELDFLDTSDYGTGFSINDLITAADVADGKFSFDEPNQELLAMMQ
ncbi:hypothetical protein [Escherichia coli]|uniref:hypothetical protein n=1 Tax=Escherichia coli TaxID=562 RepID=UPI0012FFD728|nr:hypothetical protein [Escherichia coli]